MESKNTEYRLDKISLLLILFEWLGKKNQRRLLGTRNTKQKTKQERLKRKTMLTFSDYSWGPRFCKRGDYYNLHAKWGKKRGIKKYLPSSPLGIYGFIMANSFHFASRICTMWSFGALGFFSTIRGSTYWLKSFWTVQFSKSSVE